MVEVIKISKGGASPRRRTVFLSGESDPIVTSSSVLRSAEIAEGFSVESRDALVAILGEYEPVCAMDRSLDAISRRELSIHLLTSKLSADGYAPVVVERTVKRLIELGYVDDQRYAEHVWRSELNSGKGSSRVRSKLKTAGIDPDIAEAAYNACVDDGELPDEAEEAYRLALRWTSPGGDQKDWQRAVRRLVSRGFRYDVAISAIKRAREGSNLDGDLDEGLA